MATGGETENPNGTDRAFSRSDRALTRRFLVGSASLARCASDRTEVLNERRLTRNLTGAIRGGRDPATHPGNLAVEILVYSGNMAAMEFQVRVRNRLQPRKREMFSVPRP